MSSYGMYRESKSRAIGGVCACIAKKLKINVLLVRCIVCSLVWTCVFVLPIYLVFWLITEEKKS
jgi:phage shock protein PspC (stress-responsive transcriptional regulator)